jgi:radical SAM superfamily enzyme YgiQ (UPF0313 family)
MRRPQILLVNPWIHDFAAYDLWAKPLGLLVLGSMLRHQGWSPLLVDFLDPDHPSINTIRTDKHSRGKFHRTPLEKPDALKSIPRTFSRYGVRVDEIRKDLEKLERPQAILITSLMTYWYAGLAETVDLLREVFAGVPLLLGGIYASLMPEHATRSIRVDEVLPGPGELELTEALFRRTGFRPALDKSSPPIQFTPDLDLLRSVRFLPLLTSRGCPYRCVYCASRIIQPMYRRRDPKEVIQEIEAAIFKYEIDEITLYDDAFLCNSNDHALVILDAFQSFKPKLKWHTPNGLHVSEINPRVALSMKRAGFKTVRLGLESTSDDFHNRSGRKTTWVHFLKAVDHLKEAGFEQRDIGVYLLVGLPDQTISLIENDVEMALKAGAYPKLAEYSPIPGSALWSKSVQVSHYPIDLEPLFQNCSLLPVATPEVNWEFLSRIRKSIRESIESSRTNESNV